MKSIHLLIACAVLVGCGGETGLFGGPAKTATEEIGGAASLWQFAARRLWSVHYSDDATAPWDISPDGRDVLITDYGDTDGELALVDVEQRGERRILTSLLSTRESEYMDYGSFSPDGRRIAFRSHTPDGEIELRVLDLASGSHTVLLRTGESVAYFEVRDWSPDASALLMSMVDAEQRRSLTLADARDGSLRTVHSFDWIVPDRAAFSPDGQFIAYERRFDETAPERDLFIIPAGAGAEVRLTEDGGRKLLLGWSADGSALLYSTRQRDGAASVWRLPLLNGRPAGSPARVQADVWGFAPKALVGEDLYYTVSAGSTIAQVMEVGLDPIQLEATSDALAVSSSEALAGMASYSPDGNRIAYVVSENPNLIVVRTKATDETIEYVPPMRGIAALTWSADGRALILTGGAISGNASSFGAFRFDIASREFEQIAGFGGSDGNPYALSRDGSTVYLARGSGNAHTITAHDVATGSQRVLFENVPGMGPVSPQGDRMAFFEGESTRRALMVASASGGELRVLYRDPPDAAETGRMSQFRSVAWTPDGRDLLFVKIAPGVTERTTNKTAHGRQSIMAVAAEGGDARVVVSIDDMPQLMRDTHVSDDGRRLLFTGGGDPDKMVEMWVLEGVAATSGSGSDRSVR